MPAGGVRLRMPEKRRSGLSSSARAWGPPTPRGVAGLRSIFRAVTTACSERPPPGRHARGGTLTGFLSKACSICRTPPPAQAAHKPQVEIGRSENSAARSSQCVRVATQQLERFLPLGTCRCKSAPTRRVGRQGSDAEADFRRAAPAAASRQVERAFKRVNRSARD
jgi:hypothetical protein